MKEDILEAVCGELVEPLTALRQAQGERIEDVATVLNVKSKGQ